MRMSEENKDTGKVLACEPVLKKTKVLSLFRFGVFLQILFTRAALLKSTFLHVDELHISIQPVDRPLV